MAGQISFPKNNYLVLLIIFSFIIIQLINIKDKKNKNENLERNSFLILAFLLLMTDLNFEQSTLQILLNKFANSIDNKTNSFDLDILKISLSSIIILEKCFPIK